MSAMQASQFNRHVTVSRGEKARRLFTSLGVVISLAWSVTPASAGDSAVFATVNGTEILQQDFEREVYSAARSSYYHGQPPGAAEYQQLRHEVADRLIDRLLLVNRAEHYGISADMGIVVKKLELYEQRYGDTERWKTDRAALIESLQARLMEDDVVRQVEERIRSGGSPNEDELQNYYNVHPEKFTQPKRDRVSLILIAVDPSTGAAVWEKAREEAAGLVALIRDGGNFAELARTNSNDRTAQAGGDMGYLHEGMLSGAAEDALQALSVGETSGPVTVLEGIAIFRLEERQLPKLQNFEDVRKRVADLWLRDDQEQRWQHEIARLRASSDIQIDMEYLSQAARQ